MAENIPKNIGYGIGNGNRNKMNQIVVCFIIIGSYVKANFIENEKEAKKCPVKINKWRDKMIYRYKYEVEISAFAT